MTPDYERFNHEQGILMTDDYERITSDATKQQERFAEERVGRNWASARTILDGLILGGIIWIVSSQLDSRDRQARYQEAVSVQNATIIAQIANIQYNIADVPTLREKVAHNETVLIDVVRRLNQDEVNREKRGNQ